ncbi:MAG: hypothetical protein IMZ65_04335, partial [Planctomycetes bacterium]|nr:hypothetical protein [Planctomycetota bacterium]
VVNQGNQNFNILGQIGNDVTLDLVHGETYFRTGSSMAPGAIINLLGGAGSDGHIQVYAGDNGTGGLTAGTFNLDNGQDVTVAVLDAANGAPQYVNELGTQVNVLNSGTFTRDINGVITPIHGTLRGRRTDNTTDTGNDGMAYYKNVHLAEGATMQIESWDGVYMKYDLFLDGAVGGLVNTATDRNRVNNITGTGSSLLTISGWTRTHLTGAVNGANINWLSTECAQLDPGFRLNGNTLTMAATGNSWMDVLADPGPGKIVNTIDRNDGNIWDGRGSMYVMYGQSNADTVGDAGWGDGLQIDLGGQRRIEMMVADTLTPGQWNVNKLNAQINILDNVVGNYDARFRARRADNSDNANDKGMVYLTNVHMQEGAELRMRSDDGETGLVDLFLEGNAFLATLDGTDNNWVGKIEAEGTDKTLTLNHTNGRLELRGEVLGTANVLIDNPNGVTRIEEGFRLNGRTLTIKRSGWAPAELWPNADPGAGTIKVEGYSPDGGATWEGNGFEIRRGKGGDLAETFSTDLNIELSNERRINTMVRRDWNVERVNNVAAAITIMSDGNADTVDGILASRRSDFGGDDDGNTNGKVVYSNVTTQDGATLRLQTNDDRKVEVSNLTLLGNATVNNDTQNDNMATLTNVAGAGYDLTLTSQNSRLTHLNGSMTLNQLIVNGRAAMETGFVGTLANGFDVKGGAELTVNVPLNAAGSTVRTDGRLVIGNENLTGALTWENNSNMGLASNYSPTVDSAVNIQIAMANYAGTLTLNVNGTNIGAIWTDAASIISPIAGTATQINFRGGDRLLTLGNDTSGEIITGDKSIFIDRNLNIRSNNSYTLGTEIYSG